MVLNKSKAMAEAMAPAIKAVHDAGNALVAVAVLAVVSLIVSIIALIGVRRVAA